MESVGTWRAEDCMGLLEILTHDLFIEEIRLYEGLVKGTGRNC